MFNILHLNVDATLFCVASQALNERSTGKPLTSDQQQIVQATERCDGCMMSSVAVSKLGVNGPSNSSIIMDFTFVKPQWSKFFTVI